MQPWVAPSASGAVRGTVRIHGSKSLTNRWLVLAALAEGPTRLTAPLRARDTLLMAEALRTLGTGIVDDEADWTITPGVLRGGAVDTGLAGTIMRFVPPIAGLASGDVSFDGDPYARERPMATLIDGLRQAGVEIDDEGRGRMPFTVRGSGAVPGGTVRVDASASSQFVSGLLLAAARYDKGIELIHSGDAPVPSQPHIDMTVALLRTAGVDVEAPARGVWRIGPAAISGGERVIEPDLSNAAPFLAAAMVTGGEVTISGWPASTTQAGDALRSLLARMGGDVSLDADGLTVRGTGTIEPLDADLRDVTELVTVIAVLTALADGSSTLRGLAHMRGHETDRLSALHDELSALGCEVVELDDALTIRPRPLHGGVWHAYADHRMATAGAVLGLVVPGVSVDDIGCTSKTLPDFVGMWSRLLSA